MHPEHRLRLVLVAIVIGSWCALPAEAGVWKYTCKDGTIVENKDACENHGGARSRDYVPLCGDGVLDPEEQCDNGENNSDLEPNACRSDCRRAGCGDLVIDSGEECDDGVRNSFAAVTCRPDCRLPICGDGVVDVGEHEQTEIVFHEECDDRNAIETDGCMADCRRCQRLDKNIEITSDTVLCPDRYQVDDDGDYGAVIIKASGVTLDCRGATLAGEGRGVGIVDFRSNDVTIKNCNVRGYDVGIRIQDARNVTLEGNLICENRRQQVELVDATDINGFVPGMNGIVSCAAEQIRAPSLSTSRAAVAAPTSESTAQTPKGRSAAAGKTPGKSPPTTDQSPAAGTSVSKPKAVAVPHSRKEPPAKPAAHYLLSHATRADWSSRSGKVVYGDDTATRSGRAFSSAQGRLADGTQSQSLLVNQPDASSNGFIQGVFPRFTVGSKAQFRATVALAEGADPASTVDFEVKVLENDMVNPVKRQRVTGSQKVPLTADLSPWSGKTVQLLVKVSNQGGGRRTPEAVWINPSVTYEP